MTEAVLLSCEELSFLLLISVRVLCYQPSCHSCYQLAIFSKSVAANVLLQRWRHDCLLATNSPDTVTIIIFIYEITCYVRLYSDLPSYTSYLKSFTFRAFFV